MSEAGAGHRWSLSGYTEEVLQAVGQFIVVGLQLMVLVGLVWHGVVRRAWMLPVYLVVNVAMQVLQAGWPTGFRRWNVWTAKELLVTVLAATVVIEISARVFASLPGAGLRVWAALVSIVAVTVAAVGQAPGLGEQPWVYVTVTEVLPRTAFGAALLCTATLGVMVWYHVPPDRVYQSTLGGLGLYLVSYAGPMGSAATSEVGRFIMYRVTPVVYVLVLVVWAWAVWSREDTPDVPPSVVRRLQPWR